MMKTFKYGDKEINVLKKDKTLSRVIEKYKKIEWEIDDDVFSSIFHQVLAQMLSNKVQEVIFSRAKVLFNGNINPESVKNCEIEELKSIGISNKKAESLIKIAEYFSINKIDDTFFIDKSDEEVISFLTSFKGIGKWTAEMVLIFALERVNVLSLSDYGLRKGIKILYNKDLEDNYDYFYALFSPYSSIASLYLWKIANDN